jgi:hypothetical protein
VERTRPKPCPVPYVPPLLPVLGFPYYVHSAPVYYALKRLEQDGLVTRRWDIQ